MILRNKWFECEKLIYRWKVSRILSRGSTRLIPPTVMWNDIDLYHAVRDFTTDPVFFPAEEVRAFIRELVCLRVIKLRRLLSFDAL